MSQWDTHFLSSERDETPPDARPTSIQLVGTHLRLTGTMSLGRFTRLSDLVNNVRGYVTVHDARLLRRNGDPTNLTLPKILVNQDEISFIAQTEATEVDRTVGDELDVQRLDKKPREFIVFTPGHTIRGSIHLFGETDLLGFADSTDPRFVPLVGVRAQSLADRRVISHYEFALVNRTQMIALSEVLHGDEPV
jgi:hypothetical protein